MEGAAGRINRKIREKFDLSELPVIFLTAKSRIDDIINGFTVGWNDYIPKPFVRDELLARVDSHIKLKKTAKTLLNYRRKLEQKVEIRTEQLNQTLEQMKDLYKESEEKRKEIEVLAESRKRNLGMIVREMDRLSDLAHEILDFSRGELKLDLQKISLKEFISEVAQFLKINFESSGIKYIEDLQYTGNIIIDKDRMRRVIVNLAKNAVEAMYGEQKEYCFTIQSDFIPGPASEDSVSADTPSERSGVIRISLIDNGPGIPEAVQIRIFQAFTTEGKTKGTGLGLFMCRWIVKTHNGSLTYETKHGEGTTFFIDLPTDASAYDIKG